MTEGTPCLRDRSRAASLAILLSTPDRWAQLLRRVLHVDALACPRCSTAIRTVAMVVLALLTDPQAVGKILRHLGTQ